MPFTTMLVGFRARTIMVTVGTYYSRVTRAIGVGVSIMATVDARAAGDMVTPYPILSSLGLPCP